MNCTVRRRVVVGEALKVIEEPTSKPAQGQIERKRFLSFRDGAEGWITIKGGLGAFSDAKVYLERSEAHYVLSERAPLRICDTGPSGKQFSEKVARWLEPGEAFEAAGPPEVCPRQGSKALVQLRAHDYTAGWISWPLSNR